MTAVTVMLILLGVVAVAYSVAATVAVVRTQFLDPTQKAAQGIVVWLFPVVGPMFVMHFISESDQDAVPWRCTSNDTVNFYVWQLLTLQGQAAVRMTRDAAELAIIETVSDLMESSGSNADAGDWCGAAPVAGVCPAETIISCCFIRWSLMLICASKTRLATSPTTRCSSALKR